MNTKPFFSIRAKTLILLFFCILVPFLFYWFWSYRYIRTSLDEEFVSQSTGTITAAAGNVSDYLRLADYTARGLYFSPDVLEALSADSPASPDYILLQKESRIFDFMQMLYSGLPEASQIHLSAFDLKKSLLLQSDMQRYEKDHIYLNQERVFPCEPYQSYISPTHMQSDYNFINLTDQDFNMVFTVSMPIYQLPSVTNILGEIKIDIPISILNDMLQPLCQEQETIYIIDGEGNYIYSSNPDDLTPQAKQPSVLTYLDPEQEAYQAHLIDYRQDTIVMCSRIPLEPEDWYLVKFSPRNFVYAKTDRFFNMMLYSFIAVTAAEILFTGAAVFHLTAPLKKATAYARAVTAGDLNARMSDYIVYSYNDEIGSLLIAIRKMIHSIRSFTIRQYQLELANRTSELKALQAQINPHFLHNTLQCLATHALEGGNPTLYQSITDLGQMMHYSMDTRKNLVPVKDALHYIRLYLGLQSMRFPSTMHIYFDVEQNAQDILIPKMTLQPLVENSIRHGNLLKLENSSLTIQITLKEHFLHIVIEDTGLGMTQERLDALNHSLRNAREQIVSSAVSDFMQSLNQGKENKLSIHQAKEERIVSDRIGVVNVYQRLLLYYQNQCSMEYTNLPSGGTSVHIQLDCRLLNNDTSTDRRSL